MRRAGASALLLFGCSGPVSATRSAPDPAATLGASASASQGASLEAAGASDPFVRGVRFDLPIDACVFSTGGPSCSQALAEEPDPIARRLMLHVVEARARLAAEQLAVEKSLAIPHPEQAAFCKPSGPCGGKDKFGNAMDSAYSCLTRASLALGKDQAEVDAHHARACRCDPDVLEIPVQGGTGLLGCDRGKLVKWGASMSVEQARDVDACSRCEPDAGPDACERESGRLRASDVELAEHIATVHVPRCRTP